MCEKESLLMQGFLFLVKKISIFYILCRKMTSCAGNIDDKIRMVENLRKSWSNLCVVKRISIGGGQAYEKKSGDKADRSVAYGGGNDGDRNAIRRSSIWKRDTRDGDNKF